MVKKSIAYVLGIIGLGVILITFLPSLVTQTYQLIGIEVTPANINDMTNYLLYAGIALVVIAVAIFYKKRSPKAHKVHDVPIYEGNNIVGYRRHSNKK